MLKELIERVEALTDQGREVDAEICITIQYGGPNSEGATNVRIDPDWEDGDLVFEIGNEDCCNPIPRLTSSIDAALAFSERVLPGRMMRVFDNPDDGSSTAQIVTVSGDLYTGNHISWPLAIILATLKAQSKED